MRELPDIKWTIEGERANAFKFSAAYKQFKAEIISISPSSEQFGGHDRQWWVTQGRDGETLTIAYGLCTGTETAQTIAAAVIEAMDRSL